MANVNINISEMERCTQQAFRALMLGLSYPGRVQVLEAAASAQTAAGAFVTIGETLLDLETSFYTPDPALAVRLGAGGARSLPQDQAMYQFYPYIGAADVPTLQRAPAGSLIAPDESATLVIGCRFGCGARLQLTGPGIESAREVAIDGIPDELWRIRREAARYPLGWDIFLVDGHLVMGLPRTTDVEVL